MAKIMNQMRNQMLKARAETTLRRRDPNWELLVEWLHRQEQAHRPPA